MNPSTDKNSGRRPPPPPPLKKVPGRPDTNYRHRRCEIWKVVADPSNPSIGTEMWSDRPAVVISNNVLNSRSGFAMVVYLSSSPRKLSGLSHVRIASYDDQERSTALCEQVHTVDHSRLKKKLGAVSREEMRQIDTAVSLMLSIEKTDKHSLFQKWERHIQEHRVDMAAEARALAGETTDQRITALTGALEVLTRERDAWRQLYEAAQVTPLVLTRMNEALEKVLVAPEDREAQAA